MKKYTICFMATGGITVEAEDEEDALNYFNSAEGYQEAIENICENGLTFDEIYQETE